MNRRILFCYSERSDSCRFRIQFLRECRFDPCSSYFSTFTCFGFAVNRKLVFGCVSRTLIRARIVGRSSNWACASKASSYVSGTFEEFSVIRDVGVVSALRTLLGPSSARGSYLVTSASPNNVRISTMRASDPSSQYHSGIR